MSWWETAPEGANGNGTSLYDADADGYDDDDLAPYDLAFCVSGLPAAEDCNANGVQDTQDIFDGTSDDEDGNGIPDECEPILGDIDGDGTVGANDLLILLANWGRCENCDDCPADLDDNCTVGASDLLILLANWG